MLEAPEAVRAEVIDLSGGIMSWKLKIESEIDTDSDMVKPEDGCESTARSTAPAS